MRAAAQVEPFPLRVDLDVVAFGDRVDQLDLVVLAHVGKQLLRRRALHHLAGERRVALDDLAHLGFDLRQIVGRERLFPGEVVIEAVVDHRADGDLRAGIELLHRLGHDMGRVVADELERLRVLARDDADRGVALDRRGKVVELAVELDRHRLLGKRLGDGLGDVAARDSRFEVARGTIGKLKGNHRVSPLTPAYQRR